jgi:hypothetical protein
VTLNLLVTSRWGVYLSGDFALTYPNGSVEVDLNVQKLVPVIRPSWSCLVAFSGIARTSDGLDVGSWVAAETDSLSRDASLRDLRERLGSANGWVSRIAGTRDLQFVVAGFEGSRPFAFTVGNRTPTGVFAELELPVGRPTARPEAMSSAVQGRELSSLQRVAGQSSDWRVVTKAIAEMNAAAAGRSEGISTQCVVGALLPTGHAEVQPFGIADGSEYVPEFVRSALRNNGVTSLVPKSDANGVKLPIAWVGMTARTQWLGDGDWTVAQIHAFRNAQAVGPVNPQPGVSVFSKVATASEPKTVTFTLGPAAGER